jgi:predicted chitinase
MEKYTKAHLVGNDKELGAVLFGDDASPGRDYRGRGLLHLTWLENYRRYKNFSGIDIVSDPAKLERDRRAATDSAAWFWSSNSINEASDENNPEVITKIVNPGLKEFARKQDAARRAFEIINNGRQSCRHRWDVTSTGENGWSKKY